MRKSIAALIAASLALGWQPAYALDEMRGRASVIDGDTLELHGQRIRLFGIDAPESAQRCSRADDSTWRCGRDAAFALDALVQNRIVTCHGRDIDRWNRIVAICKIGQLDLGRWMVEQGWATAYRRYSLDYVAAEGAARRARRGIWTGSFDNPESWRKSGKWRRM